MIRALILVDMQNDFLPGGSLPVPKGDEIVPKVNRLIELPFDVIVASKDWHPKEHGSFAETHGRRVGERIALQGIEQILWPVHCVQDTSGSMFAPGWDVTKVHKVFLKGIDTQIDSYSTFFDNAMRRATGLEEYLRERKVEAVYLAGLATDYCVRFSALDALDLGFETYVIADACRGINLQKGDVEAALQEIRRKGGHVITTEQVEKKLSGISG